MIYSFWKLTHDPAGTPTVLLDYLDPIEGEDEPELVPSRGLESIPLIDVEAAFLRRLPGDTYTLAFIRERTFATDLLARQGMLDTIAVTLPALGLAPVRMEILDDASRYYEFSNAFATITGIRRNLGTSKPRILEKVTITGTGFSRVLTP